MFFTTRELGCGCGCGLNKMCSDFMSKLENLRHEYGQPMYLSSACRCKEHNANEGGKDNSDHLQQVDGYCHGVDISCVDSTNRMKLVKLALKYFNRVGIHKSFIHVGDWRENPRNVLWMY